MPRSGESETSRMPQLQPQRVCFTLRIRPDKLDEYLRRHTPVRAEMLEEIARAGRRNYSLFLAGDGLLVGYYETDDDEAARDYLAASDVATAWEAEMAEFFDDVDGRADQTPPLIEIFHFGDQLQATRTQTGS